MGVEKRNFNFRLCAETQEQLREIQRLFWPFAEDLSSTIRLVIRLCWAWLFTPDTVANTFYWLQVIRRKELQSDVPQLEFDFPALRSAGNEPGRGKPSNCLQPRLTLRRSANQEAAGVQGMGAWCLLPGKRPYSLSIRHCTPLGGVA